MADMITFEKSQWSDIKLVVFDMDGTLYDQKRLRLLMLKDLVTQSLLQRSVQTLKILKSYRYFREQIADAEAEQFESLALQLTARRLQCSEETVRATVAEWVERHPLKYLRSCLYSGVSEVFVNLQLLGKKIAILSDYPAELKLAALGLFADRILSSDDKNVGVMKPNPRGLLRIIEEMRVETSSTMLIGDRIERDGEAGRRAGVRILIRSSKRIQGWQTFSHFTSPIFNF